MFSLSFRMQVSTTISWIIVLLDMRDIFLSLCPLFIVMFSELKNAPSFSMQLYMTLNDFFAPLRCCKITEYFCHRHCRHNHWLCCYELLSLKPVSPLPYQTLWQGREHDRPSSETYLQACRSPTLRISPEGVQHRPTSTRLHWTVQTSAG